MTTVPPFSRYQQVVVAKRGGGTRAATFKREHGDGRLVVRFKGEFIDTVVAREYVHAK
jgi:hypothetical protein